MSQTTDRLMCSLLKKSNLLAQQFFSFTSLAPQSLNQDRLENIPSASDPCVFLQQIPGVLVDKQNVVGNESGDESGHLSREARWHGPATCRCEPSFADDSAQRAKDVSRS